MPASNASSLARQVWGEVYERLRSVEPLLLRKLPPPATPAAIAATETAVGVALPELVVELYRMHDGVGMPAAEPWQGGEVASRSYLYSLADAVTTWEFLSECLRTGIFADFTVVRNDPGVRPDWWNPRWLPITGDGAGNHYCLDLDPARGGRVGQVVGFWHDDDDRIVVADDLAEFIPDHLDEKDWADRFRATLAVN